MGKATSCPALPILLLIYGLLLLIFVLVVLLGNCLLPVLLKLLLALGLGIFPGLQYRIDPLLDLTLGNSARLRSHHEGTHRPDRSTQRQPQSKSQRLSYNAHVSPPY